MVLPWPLTPVTDHHNQFNDMKLTFILAIFPTCRDARIDDQEDHYTARQHLLLLVDVVSAATITLLPRESQWPFDNDSDRGGEEGEGGCIFHVPEYLSEFDYEWRSGEGRDIVCVGCLFGILFLPLWSIWSWGTCTWRMIKTRDTFSIWNGRSHKVYEHRGFPLSMQIKFCQPLAVYEC